MPRAGCLPISELERVYDEICEKNGQPGHDEAFDIFEMQQRDFEGVYYLDGASCTMEARMWLPFGTVIKQASE